MAFVVSGTISITRAFDDTEDWTWDLTAIDPVTKFGKQPKTWEPERDSADTGGPMDQDYSYAEFSYEGSLPFGLVKYLLMPDDSETSIEDVQVLIDQPTLDEIAYLKSRVTLPLLQGDEIFTASLEYSAGKIKENLCITRDGQQLLSEDRETITVKESLPNPTDTLFISNDY